MELIGNSDPSLFEHYATRDTLMAFDYDGTLALLHWAPSHETQGRGHTTATVAA